jgi:hypothetical protein
MLASRSRTSVNPDSIAVMSERAAAAQNYQATGAIPPPTGNTRSARHHLVKRGKTTQQAHARR